MKIIGSWILLLFAPLLLPEVSAGASSDEICNLDEGDPDIVTDANGLRDAIKNASDKKEKTTTICVSVNATITLSEEIKVLGTKYFHAHCIGYDETDKCTVKGRRERLFKINPAEDHEVGFSFTGFEFLEGHAAASNGQDDEGGGAFAITRRPVDATFTDCSFVRNTADRAYGGAVYVFGSSTLHFTRCIFSENTADDGGGAIFAQNNVRLFIAESSFADNRAGEPGNDTGNMNNGNDILGVKRDPDDQVALTCTATTTSGTAYDLKGVSQSCSATDVPSSTPSLPPSSAPSISSVPSNAPSNAPTTPWEVITFDDFAWSSGSRGWGNFKHKKGTNDATRIGNKAPSADLDMLPNGDPALRIRDRGERSAVWHKRNQDVTAYSNLRVSFSFQARSMESGDSFFLEYSSNGGSSWEVVKEFVKGSNKDFTNENVYDPIVNFDDEDTPYELTSEARIRFRCEGGGNQDYVYIDDVSFEGCVGDC